MFLCTSFREVQLSVNVMIVMVPVMVMVVSVSVSLVLTKLMRMLFFNHSKLGGKHIMIFTMIMKQYYIIMLRNQLGR